MENNQATNTGSTEGAVQETNQAQGQTEGNNNSNSAAGSQEKLFTQTEVDNLIKNRLARERKSQSNTGNQAQTTEEGVVGTNTVEVDVTEDARQQANAIIAQANQRMIQAIAHSEATKLNINPDYIADAVKLADLSKVVVNDDGTVDIKSVTTALEAVLTRMPILKATAEAPEGGFKVGGQGGKTETNGWGSNATKKPGETKRWNKNRY